MTRAIETLAYWLLLAPAFIPLVFIDGLLYPYVAPKTLLFRVFAVLLLAAITYLTLAGRPLYLARLRNPVTWLPGVLLVATYLSSVFGVDFYHSFWSVFDRGDGLLTLTAVIVYFYGFLLVADTAIVTQLFKFIAWVASAIAIYALLQFLQELSGLDWPLVATPVGRLGSTLGNAAYLAGYLGMTLFVSALSLPHYAGRVRQYLVAGMVLQVMAIFVAATRGTILALTIAAVALLIYGALRVSAYQKQARIALAVLMVSIGLFVAFRGVLADVPFEPIQRLATVSFTEGTVASRLFVWESLLPLSLEHPLLGVGAEHVDVLFNRVYDPTAIVEQWFDRSHNAYLDYLLQYGVLGLALYLAVLATLFATAWALVRRGDPYGLPAILLALVYALQNLFLFDTAVTLWLMLIVFASLVVRGSAAEARPLALRVPHVGAVVVGVVLALLTIPIGALPFTANVFLAEAYYYHVADAGKAVEAMKRGLALNTYADLEYGYAAYKMYTEHQQAVLSGEERLIAYRFARQTLEANFARYPYDGRTGTFLGHLLVIAPPSEVIDEEHAKAVLRHAIELSPKRSQSWIMLANVELKKADVVPARKNEFYKEAIKIFEEYAALVPASAEPRYVLASLNLTINDRVSAARWADDALSVYVVDDLVARRAARYYIGVEDWPNAERMLADVASARPTEYPTIFDLAKAAFLSGNIDRARSLVETLRSAAPEVLETDPGFVRAVERATP